MFPRSLNCSLKGFSNVINYKTLFGNDITYCRFFAAKRHLKSETSENSNFDGTESSGKNNTFARLPFNDSKLSKVMLQVKSKKTRKRSNLIYFEGKRLLSDALKSGIIPLQVYFSQSKDIEDLQFPEETMLFKTPYNEMKIWSDLTTCPGILTICRRPGVIQESDGLIPVSVVCDNIREPGNLGAFIRCSAGAGVESVFLSEGCVDLWDPKVIRGGMGSHFRIPICEECSWNNIHSSFNKDTLCVIATNSFSGLSSGGKEEIVPYNEINYSSFGHIALVIGGETEGLSESALHMSRFFESKFVTIPLHNDVESLNSVSALSIILFEIKRQFGEMLVKSLENN